MVKAPDMPAPKIGRDLLSLPICLRKNATPRRGTDHAVYVPNRVACSEHLSHRSLRQPRSNQCNVRARVVGRVIQERRAESQ